MASIVYERISRIGTGIGCRGWRSQGGLPRPPCWLHLRDAAVVLPARGYCDCLLLLSWQQGAVCCGAGPFFGKCYPLVDVDLPGVGPCGCLWRSSCGWVAASHRSAPAGCYALGVAPAPLALARLVSRSWAAAACPCLAKVAGWGLPTWSWTGFACLFSRCGELQFGALSACCTHCVLVASLLAARYVPMTTTTSGSSCSEGIGLLSRHFCGN